MNRCTKHHFSGASCFGDVHAKWVVDITISIHPFKNCLARSGFRIWYLFLVTTRTSHDNRTCNSNRNGNGNDSNSNCNNAGSAFCIFSF